MKINLINFDEGEKMVIDKKNFTKEQIAKAMSCETVEDLMKLAKSKGVELTQEEAEAYFAELYLFSFKK